MDMTNFSSQESEKEIKQRIEKMSTDDLLMEVERIKLELEDYDQHAEKICERMGMTRSQMRKYAENKKNFSAEEWQQLEKARNEIDVFKEDFWKVFNKTPPTEALETENEALPTKKVKKKRHFVGMKKQKWIPMD